MRQLLEWIVQEVTKILVQFGVQGKYGSVRFGKNDNQTFAEFLALKYLQNFLFGSQVPGPVYWTGH